MPAFYYKKFVHNFRNVERKISWIKSLYYLLSSIINDTIGLDSCSSENDPFAVETSHDHPTVVTMMILVPTDPVALVLGQTW